MKIHTLKSTIGRAYAQLIKAASYLQSPVLLLMRLYWGWSFFQTGSAKLMDHAAFTQHFTDWHIPLPGLNVWIAGGTESVCGLLLLAGLASRLVAIPLIFTMIVAYLTAEIDTVKGVLDTVTGIFSDSDKFLAAADKFVSATPFQFLFVCVIVLAFGPGFFSIDRLIQHFVARCGCDRPDEPAEKL
jgi:putative oxidoreductase